MKHFILFSLTLLFSYTHAVAQCSAGEVEVQIEINTDSYGYEGYWELVSTTDACGSNTILSGGNPAVGCGGSGLQNQTPGGYANNTTVFSATACLIEGGSYRIVYVDDWADGGFEFFVYINGFLIEEFEGSGGFEYFTFTANEPAAYDLSMLHIDMMAYQEASAIDVAAEVFNAGTTVISSIELNYSVDNGPTQTQTITGLALANGERTHLTHPTAWVPTSNGDYSIKIWHTSLNGANVDANPADDETTSIISIGPPKPNVLDSYAIHLPVITEIATSQQQINIPTDLDFHPVLTKKELWVLNKDSEQTGSSTVTISNAGESNQTSVWKRDGNAWHFMSLSTGIAFSENGNFGTSPGVYDANHNGGQAFTGPALWSSDPAIYAQPSGGNGSHLDMLHASPECQGIASESENIFWVIDGYNGDVVKYDFVADHGPGNDDHSDGEIHRYQDFLINSDPQNEVVSHLVFDKSTDWLYVVDQGENRIIKINTASGTASGTPTYGPFEALAVYTNVTNYEWEVVVDSGLNQAAGIDLIDNNLIVSDYATGEVIIYDISSLPAQEVVRIETDAEGIMGVCIGPEGKIWYVDYGSSSVHRIDWVPYTVGIENRPTNLATRVWPNPSNGSFNLKHSYDGEVSVSIVDITGKTIFQKDFSTKGILSFTEELAPGVYQVIVTSNETNNISHNRLIIK